MHFSFFPDSFLYWTLQKRVVGFYWAPSDYNSNWEFSEICMRMKSHQFITILVLLPHDKCMSCTMRQTHYVLFVLKWQGKKQTEVPKVKASFSSSYLCSGFR